MMRAKFVVNSVLDSGHNDTVRMSAVGTGTAEDNSFAKATPNAELSITIDNPALRGKIKPGQRFYVDFTAAEAGG